MKVKYQNRELEVTEIDIISANECWNTYQLSDGTELKIKLVLESVSKAIGVLNDKGEPLYLTSSQNILVAKPVIKI